MRHTIYLVVKVNVESVNEDVYEVGENIDYNKHYGIFTHESEKDRVLNSHVEGFLTTNPL